jgi:hypothetical protein
MRLFQQVRAVVHAHRWAISIRDRVHDSDCPGLWHLPGGFLDGESGNFLGLVGGVLLALAVEDAAPERQAHDA